MSKKDKRMEAFVRDAFRLGTLTGFKHFQVECRGREELLVTVHAGEGARDSSQQWLAPLQGSDMEVLQPASPCTREPRGSQWDRARAAVFLVGAYAHYKVPLVWVRAGHSLLGSFRGAASYDAPLELESTQAWHERTVRVWEVVAELVAAVACPAPENPFEIEQGADRHPLYHAAPTTQPQPRSHNQAAPTTQSRPGHFHTPAHGPHLSVPPSRADRARTQPAPKHSPLRPPIRVESAVPPKINSALTHRAQTPSAALRRSTHCSGAAHSPPT